jgi:hypothetical protein
MAVTLATLTPFQNNNRELDAGRKVTAQFNPQSLKLGFRNRAAPQAPTRLTDEGSTGSSAAAAKQVTGFMATLSSLEFLFDTSETGEDVRKTTLKIVGMLQTPGTNNSPLVQFQWGSFIFNGTISSVDETIDYFSDAGVPLRATVTFGMENNEPSLATPSSTAGVGAGAGAGFSAGFSAGIGGGISAGAGFSAGVSGGIGGGIPGGISGGISVGGGIGGGISGGAAVGTTPLTVTPQGASIQGLAASAGVDWKTVAAANGIDNPRAVQAGTVVNLSVGS